MWPAGQPITPVSCPKAIAKGIDKKGFSFVEAVSQCPVQFGRASKMGKAVDILKHFKTASLSLNKAEGMSPEELTGRILVGEFCDINKPELSTQWDELRASLAEIES